MPNYSRRCVARVRPPDYDSAMRIGIPSLITGSLWAGLTLVLAVGAAAYYQIDDLLKSGRDERHVVEVMRELELLGAALSETEYAALHHSLSPGNQTISEYFSARARTLSQTRQVRSRVKDAEVRRLLADLDGALNEHFTELDFAARATTPGVAMAAVSARGETRRGINTVLEAIRQRELVVLQRFETTTASEGGDTAFFILGGTALAACLVLWAMVLVNRNRRLRDQSEAELQIEKERSANALEGSLTSVWDWNLVTNQVYLSAMWYQFLGELPSEAAIPSRQLFELVHPDDAARIEALVRDTVTGKAARYDAEHRVRRSDGDYIWIASRGKVIKRDERGKALRLIGTNRNITARKNAELKLEAHDERLQLALTSASMVSWSWDPAQDEVEWQDEPARLAGPAPASGYSGLQDMVHPADLLAFLKALRLSARTGEPWRLDCRITRTDGKLLWIAVYGQPHRSEDGSVESVIGIAQDISEIKKAEQAFTDSERQIRQIIDAVPAVIAYTDREERIRLCNKATSKMMGVPVDRIIGQTISQLFSEQTYRDIYPYVLRAMAGETVQFERTQRMPHGGTIDLSATYIPRHDMQGRIEGFYSMTTDISELKRLDRMKSEFVSTVSHELRTPLTSIRGSLGLLAGGVAGALPDKARSLVDIARNNCERLIRLINDILDIEKIESGQLVFNSKALDLMTLIEQAVKANESYAEQYRTRLGVTAALPGASVVGDHDRIIQVLTNLISNACKFSPPGSTVDIALTRADGYLRIAVIDHGPGIPEEFKARIFQRFSQADSTDTKQKGGTGLGLSISKAIVERLGGTIGFESEPDKGTSFFFTLPEWHATSDSAPSTSTRPRILVCDGDAEVGGLLQTLLAKEGYDSDFAMTAAKARELAGSTGYAAMTVDLRLPDGDGLDLVRDLREASATRHLPTIVISASAQEGKLSFSAENLGVSDWLSKPIDEKRLLASLRECAGDRSRLRILHVEDDADVRKIVSAIAADIADCEAAESLAQARAMLERKAYDLVLLDLVLPDGSGWELVPMLNRLAPPPRVVVFSALNAQEGEHGMVQAYLVKSQTSEKQLLDTLRQMTHKVQNSVRE